MDQRDALGYGPLPDRPQDFVIVKFSRHMKSLYTRATQCEEDTDYLAKDVRDFTGEPGHHGIAAERVAFAKNDGILIGLVDRDRAPARLHYPNHKRAGGKVI